MDMSKGQITKKKSSEMSLKELWQLFPIFLIEHQDCWKDWYVEEASLLGRILPQPVRINHVGSTAISSIKAKPIIDILAEFPKESNLADYKEILAENGYICMSQNADRISFNKGYTEEGFADRVFHLHLRFYGDNDERYFRDYLIEHSDAAAEYERLKLRLWKEYEHDRDGYTDAKTAFVKSYTEQARKLYRH